MAAAAGRFRGRRRCPAPRSRASTWCSLGWRAASRRGQLRSARTAPQAASGSAELPNLGKQPHRPGRAPLINWAANQPQAACLCHPSPPPPHRSPPPPPRLPSRSRDRPPLARGGRVGSGRVGSGPPLPPEPRPPPPGRSPSDRGRRCSSSRSETLRLPSTISEQSTGSPASAGSCRPLAPSSPLPPLRFVMHPAAEASLRPWSHLEGPFPPNPGVPGSSARPGWALSVIPWPLWWVKVLRGPKACQPLCVLTRSSLRPG